jgi:hypothetical protein
VVTPWAANAAGSTKLSANISKKFLFIFSVSSYF